MNVFAYYRVSTELQEKGISTQKLACQKYARENQINILAEFEEQASAFGSRDEFERMLKRLPEVEGVLVFDLDRLTRDPYQLAKLLNLFSETDKKIYQAVGTIDPLNDEDVLLARIKTDIASFERSKIKKRIRAGLERRREEGLPLGRPPKVIPKRAFDKYIKEGELIISKAALCIIFEVSRSTLLRWMRKQGYEELIEEYPERLKSEESQNCEI